MKKINLKILFLINKDHITYVKYDEVKCDILLQFLIKVKEVHSCFDALKMSQDN